MDDFEKATPPQSRPLNILILKTRDKHILLDNLARRIRAVGHVAVQESPAHTLPPTPYALHHTPYTLHPTLCNLQPAPHTLHPTPCTLHPTPCILHPTPYTTHPTACILQTTQFTLHPTPHTLQPTRSTFLDPQPCHHHHARLEC